MMNTQDTLLLQFLSTARNEGEVARRFFNNRVLPARHAIRSLIWAGRIRVIDGSRYIARMTEEIDHAWVDFQAQYMHF
jgi:hypothetical protein